MAGVATARYNSPCGCLIIKVRMGKIYLCDWEGRGIRPTNEIARSDGDDVIREAISQLNEYFEGERKEFNLPLMPDGTPFQKQVWQSLLEIPYGATRTYSEIATGVGRPDAVRATATAIGANPLSILIPCHRVIGKNGTLTGYAGGLDAKRFLLNHEGHDY